MRTKNDDLNGLIRLAEQLAEFARCAGYRPDEFAISIPPDFIERLKKEAADFASVPVAGRRDQICGIPIIAK